MALTTNKFIIIFSLLTIILGTKLIAEGNKHTEEIDYEQCNLI